MSLIEKAVALFWLNTKMQDDKRIATLTAPDGITEVNGIEYLSDGIKVGILDIYLDTDVLFGEDIFKAGMAFTNYNLPFEAIFEKSEDEIYSDLKSEISAVKFLNHMQNFVDSRKAI